MKSIWTDKIATDVLEENVLDRAELPLRFRDDKPIFPDVMLHCLAHAFGVSGEWAVTDIPRQDQEMKAFFARRRDPAWLREPPHCCQSLALGCPLSPTPPRN